MGRERHDATSELGQALATSRVMARSLGALYTSGAALAFFWVALHRPAGGGGDSMVAAMAAVAMAGGLVLLSGVADELETSWFHIAILAVQVVITVAYASVGAADNDIRLFYVWATPFACFFFLPRQAAWHLAWVGALHAIGVGAQAGSFAEGIRIWMMTAGTLLAVGVLVLVAAAGVRRREVALRHAASYDQLTGLANRALFATCCEQALARRDASGGDVVVLLADLDRFKVVNDTHGHLAGDRLLEVLASVIERAVPAGSVVARMGGDEFAVLVDDPDAGLDVRDVMQRLSDSMCRTVDIGLAVVHTSASIGAAVATEEDSAISLLRDADLAMYRAKRSGAGGVCLRDHDQRDEVQRAYVLEQALHDAVALGQFHLVFQPVVRLDDERCCGAEVLLRWSHPELGHVSPAEFVPVAEESGMIVPIGEWVLARAVAQFGRWRREGVVDDEFSLSVNVSGHQLRTGLAETVAALLAAHEVPARRLMIELTETAIISGHRETSAVLADLKRIGVGLVLDDFGTGFSSLSHLKRVRFDAVKIDRSFVGAMLGVGAAAEEHHEAATGRSIVEAIVALGEALDIVVVAEGVETVEQADELRRIGCPRGQGFLFDRPLTAGDFAGRLAGMGAQHAALG